MEYKRLLDEPEVFIGNIKETAESLRKAGFTKDEFLYEVIAYIRHTQKERSDQIKEMNAMRYLFNGFGKETQATLSKLYKQLLISGVVFSRMDLLFAIKADLKHSPEFKEFLEWAAQKHQPVRIHR